MQTKKKLWIICGIILAIIFIGLCYWKRIGIRNTIYRIVGIEIPAKSYGYYKQIVDVDTDFDNTVLISQNDSAADKIETTIPSKDTLVQSSYEIDQQIEEELRSGAHKWDSPMVIMNPYKLSPLTAVVLFETDEACKVRVTVKGKTEETDISAEIPETSVHRVPLIGLYPNMENTVILELLDSEGNVSDSQELKVQTSGLPEYMQDIIKPVKVSGDSAYELTMVYGQKCLNPFAYDSAGDIRWYLDKKTGNLGIYHLSNGRFMLQDNGGFVPSQLRPVATNFYETDYLGRVYNLYYFANGSHHEIIEKEPGGNLLVLSSSLKGHIEDELLEVDRQTGEIVRELELENIFGKTHVNKIDWAHVNTFSYQKEDDTVLISARNLHSGIKINWTTQELVWILGSPEFWEGTDFEKYVLKPQGDITWHFQQHTVYQVDADLDNNPDTVEISMFDNHWHKNRKVKFYDKLPYSYAMIYAVDEEKMTVSQIKKLEMPKSRITSNTIYDEESNHIFGMCGWLNDSPIKDRVGMTYEFDYETGEIINQYSIKGRFYRATEMKRNYEDLSSMMVIDENYIKGFLKPAVEISKNVKIPDKQLEKGLSFKLVGDVLYVKTKAHRISQLIFKGAEHTYVYDTTAIKLGRKIYLSFEYDMPIPLQNLESDEYEIYCVYKDEYYNTGLSFKK